MLLLLMILPTIGFSQTDKQRSAREILGAPAIVPVPNEPEAKLIVDEPIRDALAKGKVFIQYRTENLRIVPVYGAAALDVSPRIGHLHITVDDLPWHWADASGEPLIIVGMKPGKHTILFEIADTTHKVLQQKRIDFEIPDTTESHKH